MAHFDIISMFEGVAAVVMVQMGALHQAIVFMAPRSHPSILMMDNLF